MGKDNIIFFILIVDLNLRYSEKILFIIILFVLVLFNYIIYLYDLFLFATN